MIAIIPCAGRGTHRRPDIEHIPKILIEYPNPPSLPCQGRTKCEYQGGRKGEPLIEHIVRPIDRSGCFERIILVLNSKSGQKVIDYLCRHPLETPVKYVWQPEPLGFGHAVLQARGEVFSFYKWNPPVLICTDDGLRNPANPDKDSTDLIRDITGNSTSTLGVQWRGNVREYGMALVKDYTALGHAPRPNAPRSGVQVERLVEKPYWDEGGLAITGIYYIRESRRLFRCLNKLVKTGRQLGGQYQLTHALQMMIDAGTPFTTHYHDWVDYGKHEDIRES